MTLPTPQPAVWPNPSVGDSAECPDDALTQADFLALFDRILPFEYLAPMKRGLGPGYEYLQAVALGLARVSTAIERLECSSYLTTAQTGQRATVTVLFSRPSAAAGAVTVKAGTIITTSLSGRDYKTITDAVFGATDLGPISATAIAPCEAWEWNVTGARTTLSGETLPGEIDTIKFPLFEIQYPLSATIPYWDTTIVVSQVADATGGRSADLDQLGADRGVVRTRSESTASFRARARTLPDVVSYDAVVRQLTNFFRGLIPDFDEDAAKAMIIETWDITYQTCITQEPKGFPGGPAELQPNAMPTSGGYDPDLFCYDDIRDPVRIANRMLDAEDCRGAFIICVPNFPCMRDYGFVLDDTANNAADLTTSMGQRAAGAPDITDSLVSTEIGCCYDGPDDYKASVYKRLYDLMQAIKAGGVLVALELQGTGAHTHFRSSDFHADLPGG